ncbi:hypothetical protein AX774_g373 [Zancudomyces culisetae]|uniref:Uncharacterized protein n=1 Tax=Zancudomyces culisetae TaxID=1213189 RepID=A0A1R1PYM0_ZANCU|nr:hypothetical protein AX774_g373 [Zancudomyces culisetae]|eukprot:OMH86058.1 hypothetical protein AX774_g373 [Zancudomyces culisetae]
MYTTNISNHSVIDRFSDKALQRVLCANNLANSVKDTLVKDNHYTGATKHIGNSTLSTSDDLLYERNDKISRYLKNKIVFNVRRANLAKRNIVISLLRMKKNNKKFGWGSNKEEIHIQDGSSTLLEKSTKLARISPFKHHGMVSKKKEKRSSNKFVTKINRKVSFKYKYVFSCDNQRKSLKKDQGITIMKNPSPQVQTIPRRLVLTKLPKNNPALNAYNKRLNASIAGGRTVYDRYRDPIYNGTVDCSLMRCRLILKRTSVHNRGYKTKVLENSNSSILADYSLFLRNSSSKPYRVAKKTVEKKEKRQFKYGKQKILIKRIRELDSTYRQNPSPTAMKREGIKTNSSELSENSNTVELHTIHSISDKAEVESVNKNLDSPINTTEKNDQEFSLCLPDMFYYKRYSKDRILIENRIPDKALCDISKPEDKKNKKKVLVSSKTGINNSKKLSKGSVKRLSKKYRIELSDKDLVGDTCVVQAMFDTNVNNWRDVIPEMETIPVDEEKEDVDKRVSEYNIELSSDKKVFEEKPIAPKSEKSPILTHCKKADNIGSENTKRASVGHRISKRRSSKTMLILGDAYKCGGGGAFVCGERRTQPKAGRRSGCRVLSEEFEKRYTSLFESSVVDIIGYTFRKSTLYENPEAENKTSEKKDVGKGIKKDGKRASTDIKHLNRSRSMYSIREKRQSRNIAAIQEINANDYDFMRTNSIIKRDRHSKTEFIKEKNNIYPHLETKESKTVHEINEHNAVFGIGLDDEHFFQSNIEKITSCKAEPECKTKNKIVLPRRLSIYRNSKNNGSSNDIEDNFRFKKGKNSVGRFKASVKRSVSKIERVITDIRVGSDREIKRCISHRNAIAITDTYPSNDCEARFNDKKTDSYTELKGILKNSSNVKTTKKTDASINVAESVGKNTLISPTCSYTDILEKTACGEQHPCSTSVISVAEKGVTKKWSFSNKKFLFFRVKPFSFSRSLSKTKSMNIKNHHPFSSSRKNIKFDRTVAVFESYTNKEYDRSGYQDFDLDEETAMSIKCELNEYKRSEMRVHEDSIQNTHYIY